MNTQQPHGELSPNDWQAPIPLGTRDVPTFPVEFLPQTLGDFAAEVAEAYQVPVDLPAVLELAVIGATIAKKVKVQVTSDWCEPVNLYAVVALPPAHRKSAVFSAVTAPLQDAERKDAETARETIAQARQERHILERALKKAEERAANANEQEHPVAMEEAIRLRKTLPEIPSLPRLLVDDVSPEKLVGLLGENGGRIALMSAEGGVFDMMAGKYSSGVPNLDVYLKAHAGDMLRVDRVNREAEFIDDPALTLGIAVQPEVLKGLVSKPGFRGRGLLGRLLFSMPPSLLGRREIRTSPVYPHTRLTYHNLIRRLHHITPISRDGRSCAHAHNLSPEALYALNNYRAAIEPELGPGGRLEHLTDWAGKLPGAIVRIAAALHCATYPEEPWARSISSEMMRQAIAIGAYFEAHALATFDFMGSDPVVQDAKAALAWLSRQNIDVISERTFIKECGGGLNK